MKTQPIAPIEYASAEAYNIPTDAPEADGTFAWKQTTMVTVELRSGRFAGFGYTYAHAATASLVRSLLQQVVLGEDGFDIPAVFARIRYYLRNVGVDGIGACAQSAIDIAMWDLKAQILEQPLALLLGRMRDQVPVYGSGGFTSYSDQQLQQQFSGWKEQGITRFKMKIGSYPEQDLRRIASARQIIGDKAELFVDGNGAFDSKQALAFCERMQDSGVSWFEEPVSSDDLAGMRLVREGAPGGMEIAAGEYGWREIYFRHMLATGAVDVLQADATRCGGVTGFLQADAMADAYLTPLSAHCAPTIHMHLGCAARRLRHLEYFHDHVRIEQMLFDGFQPQRNGVMKPDLSRPGLGIELKRQDAERFRA